MMTEVRTEPDPGALRDEIAIALFSVPGVAVGPGSEHVADAIMPIIKRHLTAAEAKGAPDERARVLRLLGDEATVEKVRVLVWPQGTHTTQREIRRVLAALRALIERADQ